MQTEREIIFLLPVCHTTLHALREENRRLKKALSLHDSTTKWHKSGFLAFSELTLSHRQAAAVQFRCWIQDQNLSI